MTHPTWIFDLDNTLHDADHGIFPRINELMTRYIMDKLAVDEEAAHTLRERYWQQYGATLRGLVEHHGIDPHHFLRETHPTEVFRPMLRWEPDLDSVLRTLPGRKILLSNGPQHYVEDLLRAMGVHQHFCAHYGVERLDFTPKPAASAFRRVLVDHHLQAQHCVMVEDSLDNLKAAKALGMKTVWLSRKPQRPDYVDARISRISELSRLALAG
ncbi:pyrimidine 5'-nucleotidase [Crenobacter caeni]|uniref:Pyrimidine 5'-nucleotidase n=1 Tax=Crenobacter caeni TaxID=2705474 RepID=A0A6B2KN32_9NEIS|nr:pyrimidine 5'-nucleotidase [Crenobacter caeni]NDV11570.1 pyrimidine 5'-nucleotidase [Crenobacter caeni]